MIGLNTRRRATYVGLAMVLVTSSLCPASAMGAFAGFPGTWTGSGSILMTDGSRETIRCRADYLTAAAEDALNIHVTCASDSYKVDIVADVTARDGVLSGSWRETTRQVEGDVSGRIPRSGQMQASLAAFGGGIQLGATTNGKRQAITLRSQGTDVAGADITLRRR